MTYTPPAGNNAALSLPAGYTPPPGNAAALTLGNKLFEIDQAVEIPLILTVALDQAVEIPLLMTTVWETAVIEINLAIATDWEEQAVDFDINFYLEQFNIINLPTTTPLDQACVIWINAATELDQAVVVDLSARTEIDQAVVVDLPIAGTELDQAVVIDLDASDLTPLDQAVIIVRPAYPQSAISALTASVAAGGVQLQSVSIIRIRRDRANYYITGSLDLADRTEYLNCPDGTPVVVALNGSEIAMRVIDRKRSRTSDTRNYTLDLASQAVVLGDPYATRSDGRYIGMASELAADLAGNIPLTWNTVESYIAADILTVTGGLPIDTMRTLSAAPGAIVVSEWDGSLTIEPQYPLPVTGWMTATPDYTIIDTTDIFDDSEDDEWRQVYNKYHITNAVASGSAYGPPRIEPQVEDDGSQTVRVYTVPWNDSLTLRHTGGPWVQLEALGDEIRTIVDETVTIIGGVGNCAYPVYQMLASDWREAELGGITPAEDGQITAAITEDSLLSVTYRTRSRNFRLRNTRDEEVLIVAETVDSATGVSVLVQRAPADSLGAQVQDPLITSEAVARERGRNLIDGSCSSRKSVPMTCPFTGLMRPGAIVEVLDTENPRWRGMLLSQDITVDLSGEELVATSALTIEREAEA